MYAPPGVCVYVLMFVCVVVKMCVCERVCRHDSLHSRAS